MIDKSISMRQKGAEPLGELEWVALPEFGISCMQAQLSLQPGRSVLQAEGWTPIDLDGTPGLCFLIYPLSGDPETFVQAAAPLAASSGGGGEWTIRTLLVLGERERDIELVLVPRCAGTLPLTLRADVLGDAAVIAPGAAGLAGLPGDHPGGRALAQQNSLNRLETCR